jgi:hypothetical protein
VEEGQQRRRWNFELYNLRVYDGPGLFKYVKLSRIKWPGHVVRIDNNRATKRIFDTRPEGKEELEDVKWDGRWCRPEYQMSRREEFEEPNFKY